MANVVLPWTEASVAEEKTLSFDGINQELQDELDAENFARGVRAPAAEDPGGKAFVVSRRTNVPVLSPSDAVRITLSAVSALIPFAILGENGARGGAIVGYTVGAAILGGLVPTLVNLVRAKKAAPVKRSSAETFLLSISPAGFVCKGSSGLCVTYTLKQLQSFSGFGHRLSVVLAHGGAVRLPCVLVTRAHEPLAAKLNDILRGVQSTLTGYRG